MRIGRRQDNMPHQRKENSVDPGGIPGEDFWRQCLFRGVRRIITGKSSCSVCKDTGAFLSSTHPVREICFVLEGLSRYMIDGKVYDIVPGTAILVDRWENHAFGYLREDRGLLHFWGQVDKSESMFIGNLIKVGLRGEYKVVAGPIDLPSEYIGVLLRRWNALNSKKDVSPEIVSEYMRGPLNFILDGIAFQLIHRNTVPDAAAGTDPVIEAMKEFIRMSNARGCSLERLEQVSGYSRFHLSHRFRETAGCSIREYISRVRADYTEAALKQGRSQKEIAFELGFSSPSNFWNWWRKHRNCH